MKRRIKITIISLIIFLISEITVVTFALAGQVGSIIYHESLIVVDNNGEGDYQTIQEAINNAQQGSTIYVKKGEYKEVIMIKKQIQIKSITQF